MVMFGALGKRRGPFDPPETYQTPGIGDGLPGATPMADPGLGIPMPQAPVAAAMDKPKFGAWDAVGAIGDGLQALGGGQGTYLPLLLRQNQERQRAAQATQQAQAERNDWLWKETWKRDNPAPVAPHYWETNDGSLGVVGPDGKPTIAYKDPVAKQETIQVRDPATGEVKWYKVPVGGGDQGISPAPGGVTGRPAIGSIIDDPRKAGAGSGQGGFR